MQELHEEACMGLESKASKGQMETLARVSFAGFHRSGNGPMRPSWSR